MGRFFTEWFINASILAGIGVGLLQLRQELERYNDLREVYLPIAREIRTFAPAEEPDRFYVRCMVNKPLDLRWQYSLPQGVELRYIRQHPTGGGFGSIGSKRGTRSSGRIVDTLQLTVGISERGHAFFKDSSGSGGNEGGYDVKLARFLAEHWNELEFQIAGEDGTASYGTDELVTILQITIPEPVLTHADQVLGSDFAKRLESPILICVGPEDCEDWESLDLNPHLKQRLSHGQ